MVDKYLDMVWEANRPALQPDPELLSPHQAEVNVAHVQEQTSKNPEALAVLAQRSLQGQTCGQGEMLDLPTTSDEGC